ncbi:MAG: hypothetical protein IKF47_01895 [Bacilli bacterium]|nr:hypothetical protein [Bacilli bacterium]
MSKKKLALIVNIIILVLELIAFGKSLFTEHSIAVEYYTNDSNIIALISSLLFIIFYSKEKEFVKDIRFVSTSCLTVTFLVVIFVLCPMYNFNYKLLMFTDNFLIFHTIVPILSIFSYIALEDRSSKNYLCLVFTIIYSIVLVTLNILNLVKGPYPFLMVTTQNPLMSLLWGVIIIGGSYVIGICLNTLNKKIKGKRS